VAIIAKYMQRMMDRAVPDPQAQKWVWFVLLWLGGLGALSAVAFFVRGIFALAG